MAMKMPVFYVPLFKDGTEKEREFTLAALREMLEALVRVNVMWLATHPHQYIPLYQVPGLKWQAEKGTENWLSIPEIYKAVVNRVPVDCEDLACARAAELRYHGVAPFGKVKAIADIRGRTIDGNILMHAFVRYPDGSVEDPSTRLGMPGEGAEVWERKSPTPLLSLMRRQGRVL